RTDRALDGVGIDLDAAIVEEAGEPFPARERVADRLGELGLLADQAKLLAQPGLKLGDDCPASFPAHGKTCLRRQAADVDLDVIEFGDAPERFAGDRRWTGCGEFVEAPAHMRPAEGERCAALVGQHAIAAITVDLQDTAEAGEMGDRPFGLAIRRIDISHTRRIAALPWPVVTRVGPELAGLGSAAAG